jgi:hypothetical protein
MTLFMNQFIRVIPVLAFIVLLTDSCKPKEMSAQEIVDQAIALHGGERYNRMAISFDFRDRHYTAYRNNGIYRYTREFTDKQGVIKDVLTNDGFQRYVNGDSVELPLERSNAFANSVNSVIYFALLPNGLNDEVVKKKLLDIVEVKGQQYYKIEVSFEEVGGGEDHEDVFIYWFHTKNFRMDYLAYQYHTEGGGMRFRAAFNQRIINGLLLADFYNYKPLLPSAVLDELDERFVSSELEQISEIKLENITISLQ